MHTPLHLSRRTSFLAVLVSLGLSACSLIPPHLLPDFMLPEDYRETRPQAADSERPVAPPGWKLAGDALPPVAAPWALFQLPELPELLARQEAESADLAVYRARLAQAAAVLDQAQAGLWPGLSASAGSTRARTPASGSGGGTGNGSIATSHSASLSSSWEIDLWGRLRATAEASKAAAAAADADLAGARLSAQAQLVQTLLNLRVVDLQKQLLEASVADYRVHRDLTAARVRYGVAGPADLAQAESQLRSAEAQAIDTGVQRAQYEHALAVLLGELPARFQLPALPAAAALRAPLRVTQPGGSDALPLTSALAGADSMLGKPAAQGLSAAEGSRVAGGAKMPTSDSALQATAGSEDVRSLLAAAPVLPEIPLQAPSVLLERRPDIAAAVRRTEAANARVGVARAAFFPVLSLSASLGGRASSWGDVFDAPARLWSVGPALTLPLFDAGLRSAQKAQAEAAREESVAAYRQTVLAAFREVEDQLAAGRILAEEAVVQAAAVQAAQDNARLLALQYQAGTASSLQLIVANAARLSAEKTALDLHLRRLTVAVTLIRALGGGWAAEKPPAGN